MQALEDGLKAYLATLIECLDECEVQSNNWEMMKELGGLLEDPPGINALGQNHLLRKHLSVIRAKYFLLNHDLVAAKTELTNFGTDHYL